MNILKNIEPQSVMFYFEEISKIPRGSKEEKLASDWLVNFAQKRKLEVIQDEFYNVIIKKDSTPGYEKVPPLIIQGHIDMVCEKNQDTVHNFSKDGIQLKVNGDLITGSGTTLGADNGIAIAFALALLDSTLPHPALEVVLTSDEEMGFTGALNLDTSHLKGKLMINLDSGEEGKICVSCAGGARTEVQIPLQWELFPTEKNAIKFEIRGLQGGHSGTDINLQRGNANKILGRLLNELRNISPIQIAEISGGAKDNAIPREADAIILFENLDIINIKKIVNTFTFAIKEEYRVSDSNIEITLKETRVKKSITREISNKILDALILHPNGINTWSLELPNLVESSINLGAIIFNEFNVTFSSAVRSSLISRQFEIIEKIKFITKLIDANFIESDNYPAWKYNPNSKLRDIFIKVYKSEYNKEIQLKATHGGNECGIFFNKISNIDIIAFGPNIRYAHTPEESISISSILNVWNYFIKGIEVLKNYY